MIVDPHALKEKNSERWAKMHVDHVVSPLFDRVAARLCALEAKMHYEAVSAKTKVPWWAIAVIHEREASQSWRANLAQGDPWDQVSTHVPRFQGPFRSWEEAACNALVRCSPYAGQWGDWTSGGALTLLEDYNGTGYAARGLPSPYLWSGTDQYKSGKYIADGHFDAAAVDHQLGCAGLIARMALIDHSVKFDKE